MPDPQPTQVSSDESLGLARAALGETLRAARQPVGDEYVDEAVDSFREAFQPVVIGPSGPILGYPQAKTDPRFIALTELLRDFWSAVIDRGLRFDDPEWRRAFVEALRGDPRRRSALKTFRIRLRSVQHPATWVARRRGIKLLHAIGVLESALERRLTELEPGTDRSELEEELGLARACDVLTLASFPMGRVILHDGLRIRLAEAALWFKERGFTRVSRRLDGLAVMDQEYLDPLGAARPRRSGTRRTTSIDPGPDGEDVWQPSLLDRLPAAEAEPIEVLIADEVAEFLDAYLLKHDDRHLRATRAYLRGEYPSRRAAADAYDTTPDRIRGCERELRQLAGRILKR